ncbi:MAG TPA: hypothetical protein VMT76_07055 [Puia sp.]|nr:hypothetical protein [Puia sp.]
MKKIKFLSAILAISFVAFSAFTKPKADTTYYANVGGSPLAVQASQEGITWKCVAGNQYCVYLDQAMTHPRESQPNKLFQVIQ